MTTRASSRAAAAGRGRLGAVKREVSRAGARVRAEFWPIVQQTLAATGAWLIARHLVHHHEPFFAPVAAVVALNAARGERGTNTVRLLLGVGVGILTAELALAVLGSHGYGTLACATFAAMLVAVLLGGERIVIAQAAVSAILAVVTSNAEAGPQRFTDALIGSGVALLASQILFPPEPVALLRRAETATAGALAHALEPAALALRHPEHVLTDQEVLDRLRAAREALVELDSARSRSTRVASRSLLWRARGRSALREAKGAGQLVVLGGSCLALVRVVMFARSYGSRAGPAPDEAEDVLALSLAIGGLGRELGELRARRAAASAAQEVLRRTAQTGEHGLPAVREALRMVALDTMLFAGVDRDEVAAAQRAGWEGEQSVEGHVGTPVRSFTVRLRGRRRPRPPDGDGPRRGGG
ncbi:FUSC family protein [Streptomyces naganishii]|uniref:Integral membrane bound transporter domain-containing protein n=1 Tax=Streptomyces naganishii JCM 4654 TaxID=1306179 RepID=A0A918Y806_9ACTN|nr:FUSC family protein [Streptomyces naganishii]GHD93098.1 hypothetical protein GCM10010508_48560 [Streptomyces naganishii JCM 4654]